MKRFITLILLSIFSFSLPALSSTKSAELMDQEWHDYVNQLKPLTEMFANDLEGNQDALTRQEFYEFLYSQIALGYIMNFYANPEQPDFVPQWSHLFYQLNPNPDDVYLTSPLDDKGVYKISGYRGTVKIIDFQIGAGGFVPLGEDAEMGQVLANYNIKEMHVGDDGWFEFILSPTKPEGFNGNWRKLEPGTRYMLVRQRSYDWIGEQDANLAIDRLDTPVSKPRLTKEEINQKISQIPMWVENWVKVSFKWAGSPLRRGLLNKMDFVPWNDVSGLKTQRYYEGAYDLEDDQALIIENQLPESCDYWNMQLIDDLWRTTKDAVTRQVSINGFQAHINSDGKFRFVVSAKDPGVPNWLDTNHYKTGILFGRWTGCSSAPLPTITKVKYSEIRKHLPIDTPVVTPEIREQSLRLRKKGAQLRHRW